MNCNARDIIKPSQLRDTRSFKDGDTEDIITAILRMDREADKYINSEAAQCLRGNSDYETLRNVRAFVRSNIKYRPDRKGKEIVKSPAALFALKSGDCKSFSIAEAAILRALGFKGIRYRFAAYDGGKEVTHVYIVVRHKGKDMILDAVYNGGFDREANYSWKKDIPAATAKISGIHGPTNTGLSFSKIVGFGLIAWAFIK